ncbi:MAG: ABC transporter, partial [Myxococcota bacterium]|nr:ABC transporter [Myxococcota bacterium]
VQFNNQDLFLNALAWSVGEDDQISIRPNEASQSALSMNVIQGLLVWLTCMLIAPGLALAGAIGTWRRRRSL